MFSAFWCVTELILVIEFMRKMTKRFRSADILDMIDKMTTSDEEESSGDDTIIMDDIRDVNISSEDESSDEDVAVSDSDEAADAGQWMRATGTAPDFAPLPFTVPNAGFQLSGASIPTNECGFFQQFFTDDLLEEIVVQTNVFAHFRLDQATLPQHSIWRDWRDVDLKEMKAYLGVVLNMALNAKPNIQDYFSKEWLNATSFFTDVFCRRRFFQIHWMLHISPPVPADAPRQTRAEKVRHVLTYIKGKCQELYVPERDIAVDETTISFKGHVSFKMYNPQKPTKWGLRIYVLAESLHGYICTFVPYYGKRTTEELDRPGLPFTSRIVLTLCRELLEKSNGSGYHLFTDRFYTGYHLAMELLQLKIQTTGTVMRNRQGLPDELKRKKKMKAGEVIAFQRDGNATAIAWQDKRPVLMLSTVHGSAVQIVTRHSRAGTVQVSKPVVIIDYTAKMGAVDRADHLCTSYNFGRKSVKWWRKSFFWLLEVACVNSFILFNIHRQQQKLTAVTHLKFRRHMIEQLVGDIRAHVHRCGRPSKANTIERLNGKLHIPVQENKMRDCVVCCSDRKTPGGRKRTNFACKTCPRQPHMHPAGCFEKWHTQAKLK